MTLKIILSILFFAFLPVFAQPPIDYVYKAKVAAISDGDTITVLVDLGFNVWTHRKLRLLDVYAAEKKTPNGPLHTEALTKLIPLDSQVIIKTTKDRTDRYGRIVAEVWNGKTNVNESMRAIIGSPQGTGVK